MTIWAEKARYRKEWNRRAAFAATFIAPGHRVLDLGCGDMALRQFLATGCAYTPSDIVKWSDDVIQCDLDRGEFPTGTYDVITLLGVLEFLDDVPGVLARCRSSAPRLVLTFHHRHLLAFGVRRQHRKNYFPRRARLTSLITAAGYSVQHAERYRKTKHFSTWLYSCGD